MAWFRKLLGRQSLPVSIRGDAYSRSLPVRVEPSLKMYMAAVSNDILSAQEAMRVDAQVLTRPLNEAGDRAAHLAARMGHIGFLEKILTQMSNYDHLLSRDGLGHTPLTYAAVSGRQDIARLLLRQNRDLLWTADGDGKFPIYLAAVHLREDVASFLVDSARTQDFQPSSWFHFLIVLVEAKFYGVATCIIDKFESEASALLGMVHGEYRTILHVLAKQVSGSESWSKLVDKVWGIMVSFEEKQISDLLGRPCSPPVVLVAAKVGNVRFISRLVKDVPSLLLSEDEDGHIIFHIAVIYRRIELFTFRKEIGILIDSIALKPDRHGNNLLHHAAKIAKVADSSPTDRVSEMYPLMELKTEIDWFAVMCDVLQLYCRDAMNRDMLTPRQLFAREHEAMLQQTKAWLRRAVKSCSVVVMMIMPLGYGVILNSIQSFDDRLFHKIKVLGTAHVLAIYTSLLCLVQFWHLGFWNFSVEQFSSHIPHVLFCGLISLFVSIIAVIEVAFSTFLLKFSESKNYAAIYLVYFSYVLVAVLVLYPIRKYFTSGRSGRAIRDFFLI